MYFFFLGVFFLLWFWWVFVGESGIGTVRFVASRCSLLMLTYHTTTPYGVRGVRLCDGIINPISANALQDPRRRLISGIGDMVPRCQFDQGSAQTNPESQPHTRKPKDRP
ncbi:hypothetical protein HOY80DRAFT_258444 [Tuber brumale]|nr:hypothetical protein HOY80DRAFT_258444 [Tuber brumale]